MSKLIFKSTITLFSLLLILGLLPGAFHAGDVAAQEPKDEPIQIDVVGGQPASPGEYPWQALIFVDGFMCGGSLIDAEWVLTAAHCVYNYWGSVYQPSDFQVTLGDYYRNLNDGREQIKTVSQVIAHGNYNSTTNDYDVALLRLSSPAVLNTYVSTISLNSTGNIATGTMATVTGWGTTSSGGSSSNVLMEVDVPVVSNTTCNASASYNGQITESMLCAGYAVGGKDSCQGDSGGPLIISNGSGGWQQAGVVSWGDGCAEPDKYGVYARVSQIKSWVDFYVNGPSTFVFLPLIIRNPAPSTTCTPDPSGESSNIADSIKICSGQTVSGQVNRDNDEDDVYKIWATSGQQLTISMNGTGGDADIYLYPPGSTNVWTDTPAAYSDNYSN